MKVAVAGGGVSGLAAAWELARRGCDVTVYEPGRLGGKLLTSSFLGLPVDEGPDALLARVPEGVGLCRELGLGEDLVAPAASKALLYTGGKLRPLPDGLVLGAPARLLPVARSRILSPSALARAACDLVLPRSALGADAGVGELVSARFGRQVATELVGPLVGSIYAGPVEGLSAATATPQLLEAARAQRSLLLSLRRTGRKAAAAPDLSGAAPAPVFVAPRRGMQSIADALADGLSPAVPVAVSGLRLDGNSIVVLPDEQHYEAVVVAVPAPAAVRLLGPLLEPGTAFPVGLSSLRFASVAIVTLGVATADLPVPPGYSGVLVGGAEGMLMTACSFGSNKWPHWGAPGTSVLRISVGRAGDERWTAHSDEDLVGLLLDELGRVLGGRRPAPPALLPGGWRVSRWPDALPQYPVGHLANVAALRRGLAPHAATVSLAGASFGRVGIPACIASARAAAAAVLPTARAGVAGSTSRD
ncbi:MAG TPA: protoporphyrinogen oxidase [Acidimicrobiales bacterium]|nr:protoporphyrinogen oxidase [Acidimicrobiales bacterium]